MVRGLDGWVFENTWILYDNNNQQLQFTIYKFQLFTHPTIQPSNHPTTA
jgi:hypothetical protein